MAQIRIGCSGWSYRHWKGPFYPADLPARRWFAFYAAQFDTVELNSTFYRLPTEATVRGWAAQAPPGFCYAAKLGAFGSHRMKLNDAASWLPNHLARVDLLGPAAGPTLVQLPGTWGCDLGRLDAFLAAATELGGPARRWAVELRHAGWLTEPVFDCLARHGAALVIHDLLPGLPWHRTTSWTYLRFHGPHAADAPYRDRYGSRRLHRYADRLTPWLADGCDVFAYFNNDGEAAAVADAHTLRRLLGRAPSEPVPGPVP